MENTSVEAVGRVVRDVAGVGSAVPFMSWNTPPLLNAFDMTIPSHNAVAPVPKFGELVILDVLVVLNPTVI